MNVIYAKEKKQAPAKAGWLGSSKAFSRIDVGLLISFILPGEGIMYEETTYDLSTTF